jgi:hypothetical protein
MSEKEKSFEANPNQKVYDMPHQVDHLVEVTNIYFAEQVKKYKLDQKTEEKTVSKNKTVKVFLDNYKKDKDNKHKLNVTVAEDTKPDLKKGNKVTVNWQERVEDGFDYPKIHNIKVGKKLFVVAKCSGDKAKLTVEIFENKLTNTEAVYDSAVKFLIGDAEKAKIEFTLEAFKLEYVQEITLKPKSKEEYKKLVDKYNKRKDKNAFLFLKGEVVDTPSDINFLDGLGGYQNSDSDRFEAKMLNNGYYFNYDGTFEESIFVEEAPGDKNDVYAFNFSADKKSMIDIKKLSLKYLKFIENASIAYGECSIEYDIDIKFELYAIAYVNHTHSSNVAYGKDSDGAVLFRGKTDEKRNGTKMQTAIAAVINVLTGGHDYSNGADSWDGVDVLTGGYINDWNQELHFRQRVHGNRKGISDPNNQAPNFYDVVKEALENKVSNPKTSEKSKKDYQAKLNNLKSLIIYKEEYQTIKGKQILKYKPCFKALATYAASIFYKELR